MPKIKVITGFHDLIQFAEELSSGWEGEFPNHAYISIRIHKDRMPIFINQVNVKLGLNGAKNTKFIKLKLSGIPFHISTI